LASLVPLIVAGLSGLWLTEDLAKIPNHDGSLLRFARDSLLEGAGFEPSVPLSVITVSRPPLVISVTLSLPLHRKRNQLSTTGDRGFDDLSLKLSELG
jgi:hypothetical protein